MIRFDDLDLQTKISFFPNLATPYEDPERNLRAFQLAEEQFNKVADTVEALTNMVNTMSLKPDIFIYLLSGEHRTLQQSATGLMFKWIQYAASDNYRFDGRNQATHDACKKIVSLMGNENTFYLPLI